MWTRLRWDVVLGIVVFVEVLRVFLPSLITLFGQAGGTPAEYMGLYALSWFLAAFLVVPLARLVSPRSLALTGGAGLLAARALLQFSDGGDLQLYAASAGVLAGLVWLVATAMGTPDARAAIRGFLAGLALSTVVHAALAEVDLVWRAWYLGWPLTIVVLAAFGWLLFRAAPTPTTERIGAARTWLLCGPALLLWGLYIGNPAYVASGAQNAPGLIAAVAVGIVVLITVGALTDKALELPVGIRLPMALLLIVSAIGFAWDNGDLTDGRGLSTLAVFAVVAFGQLGLVLCLPAVEPVERFRPSRNGLAMAGGMVAFVVLVFGYYAAYDLAVPNWWVAPAAAVLVAAIAVPGGGSRAAEITPGRPTVVQASLLNRWSIGAALIAAVLAGVAPLWQASSPTAEPASDGLRVAAYNVRMGYGLDGTLSLDQQADALAALDSHVIVLSEVDRGWFLNGGRDDLRHIADRLDKSFIWAPAADALWGDAVLTDLPVGDIQSHALVRGGPTGAQALELVVRWQDTDVTVIATHLQPPPDWQPLDQVEQLAELVGRAGTPVVLAGDLNLEPDSAAWEVLAATGLVDAFAEVRPFPTIPGESTEQIDHILVSPEFSATDPANPDLPWSDHRPIAVTLRL